MPISRVPGVGLDSGSSGVAPSNLSTGAPSWDGSGNVTCLSSISVGNATPTTSGFGITFPATQSASSNANTLDDYEEGTFTPVALGTVTGGTASYSVQIGRYTKIGNRVFYMLYINYSGGTGSGSMRIGGLPFTSNSTASNYPTASIYPGNLTLTANNVAIAYIENNTTLVVINQYPVGGGTTTDVNYDGTALMLVSGHYEV
jgi:hypothetical protein